MNIDAGRPCGEPSGWRARLELGFEAREGRTLLVHRRHLGPLAVQRPFYPEGGLCHVYLLHPPAGIVGGDRLEIDVDLASGACALLTTPGATKLYRSPGPEASVEQRFRVAPGSACEWLPQETIAFPGARARIASVFELAGDARLAAWEILCLGRPVVGEAFAAGSLDLRFEVWRDGAPLLLERLRATPEELERAAGLRGLPVTATLVISGVGEGDVAPTREVLDELAPEECAVSRVEDLLVARYLGSSGARAQSAFRSLWAAVRPRVFRRPACPPRIWST